MIRIFWRTLKERRTAILAYVVANALFIWMYVALFPSIKEQSEKFNELLKNYPEGLMKAFNIEDLNFSTLESFLSTEMYSFIWPLMLIFLLVSMGGSAIAGEIEKGTIELLLSSPVSRIKILLGKYFAGLKTLVLFVGSTFLATIVLAEMYNIEYRVENFASVSLLGFLFGLAVYSISIFFSTVFSEKGRTYFLSGGLIILMYVLNIVASLKENLSDLRYFSFFYYFNASKALVHNEINEWAYIVFIGVAVVLSALALISFNKRDIAV